jgi:hypothetical protein
LGSKNSYKEWNDDNYEALKKMLSQLISLIRFIEFTPDDFFNRVRPYKAIIPKHIYDEAEEFHRTSILPKTATLSPRIGKFESNIINPKLANVIANWIDGNNLVPDIIHITNLTLSIVLVMIILTIYHLEMHAKVKWKV